MGGMQRKGIVRGAVATRREGAWKRRGGGFVARCSARALLWLRCLLMLCAAVALLLYARRCCGFVPDALRSGSGFVAQWCWSWWRGSTIIGEMLAKVKKNVVYWQGELMLRKQWIVDEPRWIELRSCQWSLGRTRMVVESVSVEITGMPSFTKKWREVR